MESYSKSIIKSYLDECECLEFRQEYMLDLYQVCEHRTYINNINRKIKTQKSLLKRLPSKQSRKACQSKINYLTKQMNTFLDLYPEYFI